MATTKPPGALLGSSKPTGGKTVPQKEQKAAAAAPAISVNNLAGYNPAGVFDGATDPFNGATYTLEGGWQPAGSGSGQGAAAPAGKTQAEIDAENRRKSDIAVLEAYLNEFGLGGILDAAKNWLAEGYDYEAVKALIRTSPQYADRFPAMKALAAKGRTISEAEYIAYERNTAELERLYGLPAGMLTSKDVQTKLLTNEVSAKELESRTVKASAAQYDLPPEFRQMMKNYYGVDSGGLTAYYLDPDVSAPLLEKQFVSAQIGMEGAVRGLSVDAGMSEFLYQQGVDRARAREGFTTVSGQAGLQAGKGETATQGDLIGSAFSTEQGAADKVKRIAQARVGAFSGGGGFANDRSGVSGLGSAAT